MLSSNAQLICEKRYFKTNEGESTWDALSKRVGSSTAARESDQKMWGEKFSEAISSMYFIPGGRILRNSGNEKPSMANCASLPISDSIESIGETVKNCLILWSYGAGIGINFTPLRQKGAPLLSKGGESSGLVSFLHAVDAVAHTIETGGNRRSGALSLVMVDHPEIFDYISAKETDGKLSYFNISVGINNDFINAVETDSLWDLKFAGIVHRTVKARDLWNFMLEHMIKNGEPGIINYDNMTKNNSYYFSRVEICNLCGEIPMAPGDLCFLGSVVLPKFCIGKRTNWSKLEEVVRLGIRFLDNIIDLNYAPISMCREKSLEGRRQGLGVMGLHDYLMNKELRYGSEKSLQEIDRLFTFIRNIAYDESVNLASEKGTFPKFYNSHYCDSSFIKRLPPKLRGAIRKHGSRGVTLISCPPTGTSSLIPEVSSGIEPQTLAMRRNDRVSSRVYIHPKMTEWLQSGTEKPDWLVDSRDLCPEDHLAVQATIQNKIDNAISKTVFCPETIKMGELSDLLLEYVRDLKGVTVYVDKAREGQPICPITDSEAAEMISKSSSEIPEEATHCVKNTCDTL